MLKLIWSLRIYCVGCNNVEPDVANLHNFENLIERFHYGEVFFKISVRQGRNNLKRSSWRWCYVHDDCSDCDKSEEN